MCLCRLCSRRNQNTRDEKEQVMFLIYCLEHASRLADEQRECTVRAAAQYVGVELVQCMAHQLCSVKRVPCCA
jgi:hypothetical protein